MLILIGVLITFGAFVGGRALARRSLSLGDLRLLSREPNDRYFAAPLGRRLLWRLSGPIAAALVAVVLSFCALRAGGERKPTTTVDVVPGGPAAEAGIQSGDQVLQVEGVPVTDWYSLQGRTKAAGGRRRVPLLIRRGGRELLIEVTTNERGRIGVMSRSESMPYPPGRALAEATQELVRVPLRVARAAEPSSGLTDLAGPIGVMSAVSSTHDGRPQILVFIFMLLALPAAMTWPLSLLLALLLVPRRRATS